MTRRRGTHQPTTTIGRVPQAEGTRQVGPLRLDPTNAAVSVELSKLEPPDRAYDADVAWIESAPGRITILFGKIDRDDPLRLRSRLEVRYPAEDFVLTFWRPSAEFAARVAKFASSWPKAVANDQALAKQPALQTHSEWASFAYMSHTGTDAAIDFYHLSPTAMARWTQLRETTHMRLKPILRVQLSVFDLDALLRQAEEVDRAVREVLPSGFQGALIQDMGQP
jgi:hypothetical protein